MWEAFSSMPAGRKLGQEKAERDVAAAALDELPPHWRARLAATTFAFQPIVNIHSGVALGFECLLRGWDTAGCGSVQQFFDEAHRDGLMREVSGVLRYRAVAAFTALPFASRTRVFMNVDNREIESWQALTAQMDAVLSTYGLPPESVCLEVSEQQPTRAFDSPLRVLAGPSGRTYKVAIDDFGTGFSGLKLLYLMEPDFIKIDRFFIEGMGRDARKRLFVSSIVSIAHVLGIMVIAEGVETLAEFRECRAVGCDLVQGHFVQPPTCDLESLTLEYHVVQEASRSDRRRSKTDEKLITGRLERIPAISIDTEMSEVLEVFRREPHLTFVPVVNHHREPMGIVRESDLREYAYSNYGKDLLRNPSLRAMLPQFVVRCPVADVNSSAERVLDAFSRHGGNEGVIVVENAVYVGFLSAPALLQVINEKNLLVARDQNPLTRLPGNTLIFEAFSQALQSGDVDCTLVYFDFNHFKPFNDAYGFRAGDRAILLFAELLQKNMLRDGTFLGHIGGDDFFALVRGSSPAQVRATVAQLVASFSRDVLPLYSDADRQRGFIEVNDRSGRLRRFPLLSVSAAVLFVPAGPPRGPADEIVTAIAAMKSSAKSASDGICFGVLDEASRINLEAAKKPIVGRRRRRLASRRENCRG